MQYSVIGQLVDCVVRRSHCASDSSSQPERRDPGLSDEMTMPSKVSCQGSAFRQLQQQEPDRGIGRRHVPALRRTHRQVRASARRT
jgi:hypothetical protein